MSFSCSFFSKIDELVAQTLHDELLLQVESAKKSSPKNFSKFRPAQVLLQKLKQKEYADALRLLAGTDEDDDPVEKIVRRLSTIKHPCKGGRGVKKAKHRRPNRKNGLPPAQLKLDLGKYISKAIKARATEKSKLKPKRRKDCDVKPEQLHLFPGHLT